MAGKCCAALQMTIPLVVDHDRRPGRARVQRDAGPAVPDRPRRARWPTRAAAGRSGSSPARLEQQIAMMLAEDKPTTTGCRPVPVLSNEEAWASCPPAESGANSPLPGWARVDGRHPAPHDRDAFWNSKTCTGRRARSTRNCGRWSGGSSPTPTGASTPRQVAVADLKRAGRDGRGSRSPAWRLASPLSAETRRPSTSPAKLTRAAYKVTDDQMAALRKDLGETKLVAFVQLVAFGNFQDRLLLTLDVPAGSGRAVAAERGAVQAAVGRRRGPGPAAVAGGRGDGPPEKVADPEWRSIDFASLQKLMEGQTGREPRVSVPRGRGRHEEPARRGAKPTADQVEPRLLGLLSRNWPRPGRPACGRSPRRRSRTGSSRRASSGS